MPDFNQPEVADWSEGVQVPSVPIQQFPASIEGKLLLVDLFPQMLQLVNAKYKQFWKFNYANFN